MPASKNISVLFIEDSSHDAELAQMALERSGYTLDTELVYDHAGVVEALQRRPFDLILADFILPGFSGSLALQEARRLAPETPFIFLSGVYGEENAVNMMRSGAVDYVLKQNLALLPKAVTRAVSEVHERRRRRQAEQALQEVGVRARLAIEAARLGMWDYEPASGQLLCDQRYRAICGLDGDEPLDMTVFERLCHPDDLPYMRARIETAISDPRQPDFAATYRIQLPDGQMRWLEMRGQAFFDQGRCSRFVGVAMDITEQRSATEALKRLNETLGERVEERTRERDRTWELSRDLLAVTDFGSTALALNPAWQDVLGWPLDDLLNQRLVTLVHPDDLRASLAAMSIIRRGRVAQRFVNRLRHRDGGYRWIAWNTVPDAGHAYIAGRDISNEIANIDKLADANAALRQQIEEREKVEATLRQMQRLEAVGQLTAGVAHDFNNLLTVILTSANFLQRDLERGAPVENSLRRLNYIRTSGERGATLTSQLLAFARRQRLAPSPLDLNETVDNLLNLLKSTLGGSIDVVTQPQDGLWHALVDPTQIEMIILNLAINARDAMGDSGRLTLATANASIAETSLRAEEPGPGDYVMLSVSDTGTGMSEEVLQKAFEPFFTTKEVGKGSGLGLAQVFGFAKQSGGGARILSEEGSGTTVQVFLPRTEPAPEDGTTPADDTDGPEVIAGHQRILLVDDDPAVREVTSQMLQRLGFQVAEADSGASALRLLEDIEVDLLLADFVMPGMNGGELARAVGGKRPGLPVVFISGYAELGELGLGENLVIQKPFQEEQVARKILQALREAGTRHG
ncbi:MULTISPECIES: response regulator [unclassified Pseudomonas]|uniref:response regulator n=1 Tax=unclassified Pseudomonas TaxID=196821 RepID=UPI00244D4EF1|nr:MULTISPECIES: response regulator [unclassified Pseudomonas]MDG9929315.1 response regulator [Pseudomonas sp. GD04042]MDH0485739.1 response regulator [Pseudomonas sp. GD04015]MDH0606160.1 response regulator [Pseudomonas sp. GD03869]